MPADRPERALLDTNVVIHWPALGSDQLPSELAISAVTLAELAAAVHADLTDRERAARVELLQRVEAGFDPLPFDVAAARAYGRVAAAVRSAGRSPRARVAGQMIAAVAAAYDLPLLTTDVDDYRGLDGIVTIVPVDRPR